MEILTDPFAAIDLLGRKVPRVIGFHTLLKRLPWLYQMFTGEVPPEMVAIDDTTAIVPCPCKATAEVKADVVERCPGECGRWFWNFHGRVLVGYEPTVEPTPEERAEGQLAED